MAIPTTEVYNALWHYTANRQHIFTQRMLGAPPPWTDDPILRTYRFTNVYRVADRVTQYLLRHVIYAGSSAPDEVVFRIMLFRYFNSISTWRGLQEQLGKLEWATYDRGTYLQVLGELPRPIYNPAYILPVPPVLPHALKYEKQLYVLELAMNSGLPLWLRGACSMEQVFTKLRALPGVADFIAMQLTTDLNYSEVVDFSEMEFIKAGPGALDGIRKCFGAGVKPEEAIRYTTEAAPHEFEVRDLHFDKLRGRPLQLMDVQNLFCEISKYARVGKLAAHVGRYKSAKPKQLFRANTQPLPRQWYPPKWRLNSMEGY